MKEELQLSNKHNYSQYSNKAGNHNRQHNSNKPKAEKPKVENPVAAVPAEVKMEPIVTKEVPVAPVRPVVMPEMVNETVETAALPEMITGIVANCAKLNVRAEPSMFADVVCILDAAAEIEINVAQSNHEWFKIYTAIGAEGYCMRRFVNAYM